MNKSLNATLLAVSLAAAPGMLGDTDAAVAVSDSGPGIAAKNMPHIFDRFYRIRDGEEARSDSSGLGLAIVKRILDLHDSRILVASNLNAGTHFEFELPLVAIAA